MKGERRPGLLCHYDYEPWLPGNRQPSAKEWSRKYEKPQRRKLRYRAKRKLELFEWD